VSNLDVLALSGRVAMRGFVKFYLSIALPHCS